MNALGIDAQSLTVLILLSVFLGFSLFSGWWYYYIATRDNELNADQKQIYREQLILGGVGGVILVVLFFVNVVASVVVTNLWSIFISIKYYNSGVAVLGVAPATDPPLGERAKRSHSINIANSIFMIMSSLYVARKAGLI